METNKATEVKNYPRIIDTFGKINRDIIRPKMEALMDNYEKIHNISHNKVEDVINAESVGSGTTNNSK